MRKLFTRDRPKLAKVTPASREAPPDLASANSSEEFQVSQPQQPHYHSIQPFHQLRPIVSSHDGHHHPTPSSDDENWHVLAADPGNPTEPPPKLVPLTSSRSSSLASLPPGASPPLPNPPVNSPRTVSPFPGTPPVRPSHNKDTRERDKDRRGGNPAVSILNALNPQFSAPPPGHDVPRSVRDDDPAAVQHATSEGSIREEKKERGFWHWANPGDRDNHRRDIRERDDGQQDLMRMIGYLTATSSEDWAVVLDVCERASATEGNAKEAAKALRREFKYGEAPQQLSAARLWAVMLRNSSELFVHQCAKSKFLDTLEDVLNSQRTSPVVRERLLDVLAAAAYASSGTSSKNESSFRVLWRKVKPPGKPDEGAPFDPDDAMFNPPSPRRSTAISLTPSYPPGYPPVHPQSLQTAAPPNTQPQAQPPPQTQPQSQPPQPQPQTQAQAQAPQQPSRTKRDAPGHGQLQRVIPPEEDMRRLFQECRFAHGNAQLLSEALAFASPEDLQEKDIIKEWYSKCLHSQELIAAQIPWATAGVDRARAAREAQQQQQQRTAKRPNGQGANNVLSKTHRNKQGSGEESPVELTAEEQLLGALLEANEALISVLRVYDEIERVGIERETMERSRQETRLDRSKNVVDEHGYVHRLDLPTSLGSTSRSPSPSPSPSPQPPHLNIPAALQSHVNQLHPLPPIPVQVSYQQNYGTPQQSLALPPPAPQGPRSPGLVMHRSYTPSPERGGFGRPALTTIPNAPLPSEAPNGGVSKPTPPSLGIIVPRKDEDEDADDDEEENIRTPIRPSSKALGKRRFIETEEADPDAFNPDDLFYERTDARDARNPPPDDSGISDSDSDSPHRQQPVHYAYDAVAERTQRLLQQMSLVNGVH